MQPATEKACRLLAELLAELAPGDGFCDAPLAGVRYARARRPYPLAPVLYEPSIVLLAREAHMGLSTFHHAFRAVTATTPLQYLKTVRLHKARSYLAEPGATAREAALRAGYASASQFSREFKRLFGASPSEELGRLKGGTG